MQAPNVLADVNPSANRQSKERPSSADRGNDFRDMQNRARDADQQERRRENAGAASARNGSSAESARQLHDGYRQGAGETAKVEGGSPRVAGEASKVAGGIHPEGVPDTGPLTGVEASELEIDLEALAAQTGLSEQDLKSLLAGDLPDEVLADKLAQLNTDEAEFLVMGLQQTGVIQPAVTTQLASLNMSGNTGGRLQMAMPIALQAAMGDGQAAADKGEQLLRMAVSGAGAADSAESGQGRTSENSLLLQQANTALRAEVKEPVGSLKHYTTSLETPVEDEETWNEKMAGKMSWLANKGLQSAEIHINPPELGPVEVRIQIQNDQASVSIQSQHSSVRDMLELNSHRLKEMLEESGLNLASFDVSDQTAHQDQGNSQAGSDGHGQGRLQGEAATREGEAVTTGEVHMSWTQGVDLYA